MLLNPGSFDSFAKVNPEVKDEEVTRLYTAALAEFREQVTPAEDKDVGILSPDFLILARAVEVRTGEAA